MAGAEHRNHARAFLRKAEEYLASAQANLVAERPTAAAGDAIHAGISAKGDVEYGTATGGPGPLRNGLGTLRLTDPLAWTA